MLQLLGKQEVAETPFDNLLSDFLSRQPCILELIYVCGFFSALLMDGLVSYAIACLLVSIISSSASNNIAAAYFVEIPCSSSPSSSNEESSNTSVIRGFGSYSQVFSLSVILN